MAGERVISLEEFNKNHQPPACKIKNRTVILNSEEVGASDGVPQPEFHPEGRTCLTHKICGVNLTKPQT